MCVCIHILYIYIYIWGVAFHKIHSLVRYDTEVSRLLQYGTVLKHEGEPMDITCNMQTLRKSYAAECLNLSQCTVQKVKVKTESTSILITLFSSDLLQHMLITVYS